MVVQIGVQSAILPQCLPVGSLIILPSLMPIMVWQTETLMEVIMKSILPAMAELHGHEFNRQIFLICLKMNMALTFPCVQLIIQFGLKLFWAIILFHAFLNHMIKVCIG